MVVNLNALLAPANTAPDEASSVASGFLANLPYAQSDGSSQSWQAPDSGQQLATEPLIALLPSYLQARTDLPAGSERPSTPPTQNMPLDDSSPLSPNPPCLQHTARADARSQNAGRESWLHMPSDDEEMAASAAALVEQPDKGGGQSILKGNADEGSVDLHAAAMQSEQDSTHARSRIPTLQKRRRAFVLSDEDEAFIDAHRVPAITTGEECRVECGHVCVMFMLPGLALFAGCSMLL